MREPGPSRSTARAAAARALWPYLRFSESFDGRFPLRCVLPPPVEPWLLPLDELAGLWRFADLESPLPLSSLVRLFVVLPLPPLALALALALTLLALAPVPELAALVARRMHLA